MDTNASNANNTNNGDGASAGSGALRANAVGAAGIVFFVVAAASPLSAALGGSPAAIGAGNGAGAPGAYLAVGVVLLLFAVGYAAMSRYVTTGGGFAAYVHEALGARMGRGAAYLATVSYVAMQVGLYGIFGFFADVVFGQQLGIDLPWPVWAFLAMVLVGVLAWFDIDLSAKVLGVLMICEVVVLLVVDFAIVGKGGAHGLSLAGFSPDTVTGGALGIALMFAFASFIGFEATAIYSEEARDPSRTIPRATYAAVLLITVFLVFTVWCFVVGHGVDTVRDEARHSPDAFVFTLSSRYVGAAWTDIMQYLLITSFFAALLAFHNTIARYLLSLSRRGWGPRPLARTHPRHRSPHIAGAVQSVVGAVLVAIFVAAGLDPYTAVFSWSVGLGTLGVIVLQAWTCVAIITYFRRHRTGLGAWRTLIAPGLGGAGLVTAIVLALRNWDVLVGSDTGVSNYLPWIVPAVILIGVLLPAGAHRTSPSSAHSLDRQKATWTQPH
ncbi:APC family permease [Streptomyces sp. NPDC048297]|uniref:APC family permease n=1 Tax=Streptomyces sp. NPDC048297 TaxID=3365531 RepID=UPI003710B24F